MVSTAITEGEDEVGRRMEIADMYYSLPAGLSPSPKGFHGPGYWTATLSATGRHPACEARPVSLFPVISYLRRPPGYRTGYRIIGIPRANQGGQEGGYVSSFCSIR